LAPIDEQCGLEFSLKKALNTCKKQKKRKGKERRKGEEN